MHVLPSRSRAAYHGILERAEMAAIEKPLDLVRVLLLNTSFPIFCLVTTSYFFFDDLISLTHRC